MTHPVREARGGVHAAWRAAHEAGRAQLLILVDPDKREPASLAAFAREAAEQGADGFLVGGSLSMTARLDACLAALREGTDRPVVLFPGGLHQISGEADAILFLSILSSRNPEHLIGQHVVAAPLVRALALEAVATAYLLIASDVVSSAEYMSYSKPIPRAKTDIAAAHAMAAELLGMQCVYLEAGSGASESVPDLMVRTVASSISIPLIVGGGIRTPEDAAAKVCAGASIIVIGNHFESSDHAGSIGRFADAIHGQRRQPC